MLCHCSVLAVVLRLNFTKKSVGKAKILHCASLVKLGKSCSRRARDRVPSVSRNPLSRQSANDPSVTALSLFRNLCAQPDAETRGAGIWEDTARRDLKRARQDTRTRIWRVTSPPWRYELRCLSIYLSPGNARHGVWSPSASAIGCVMKKASIPFSLRPNRLTSPLLFFFFLPSSFLENFP